MSTTMRTVARFGLPGALLAAAIFIWVGAWLVMLTLGALAAETGWPTAISYLGAFWLTLTAWLLQKVTS